MKKRNKDDEKKDGSFNGAVPLDQLKKQNFEIRNLAQGSEDLWKKRIFMFTPSTGLVRMEWVQSRYSQIIPTNWSMVDVIQFLNPFVSIGYQLADAQNLMAKHVVEGDYEWVIYCFQGDTLVETMDGSNRIRDIEVGDYVRTDKGRFRKVLKKFKTGFYSLPG